MARGVARKGQGKTAAPPAKAVAKRKSEGLELPSETRPLADLPPAASHVEHRFAGIFPMLVGKARDEFQADIKARGVNDAVTLIKVGPSGAYQILDGRNRRLAAALAGLACPAEEYIGKDALRFVLSRNLQRRHLDESQRSMVAADAEGFKHGGDDGRDMPQRTGDKPAAEGAAMMTREEAATVAGASVRSVARAARVKAKGTPQLADAVRQGLIPVSAAAQAVDLSAADQQKVIDEISAGRAKTAKQVIKRGRVKERNAQLKAKVIANPTRQYAVIMSDDEWKHETWSEQGQDRAADMHYSTSDAEALIKRQLAAAENAVYYMWTIVPHQPLAFEIMKARGFTYRSQIAWWKIYPGNKPGLGYWSRIEHELLLIGTRGDIACPAPGDNWRSVQLSFVGEHSAKPEWCYRMIEAYHAGLVGTMIEYNARKRRRGWSAWGNEIGLIEPPHAELQAEFEAAPVLPDPDYINIDRAMFTRLFRSTAPAEVSARKAAATVTSSPAAALKAIADVAALAPDQLSGEMPENPDLRALWLIEAGRVGEVAASDLKRVIAAGYATPGRANRKKGDSRPALISAHGAAELKAWRQRVADETAFDAPPAAAAPPLAGHAVEESFKPPAFLLAESAERAEADKKRDAKRGPAG